MLLAIALAAWKGFNKIFDGFNHWTYLAFVLIFLTILLAAPAQAVGSYTIGINGRFIGEVILLIAIVAVAAKSFSKDELSVWIWETWKFVKQIFPADLRRVLAGIVRVIIPATWVQTIAGRNTIWANLIGVLFGVLHVFPNPGGSADR